MIDNNDEILNWLITISAQMEQLINILSKSQTTTPVVKDDFSDKITSAEGDTFGERLAYVLKQRGFKAQDLAVRANLNPSAVSRYLSDKTFPRRGNLKTIASILNVDISVLMEGIHYELNNKEYWLYIQYKHDERIEVLPTTSPLSSIDECINLLKSYKDSNEFNILKAWVDIQVGDNKLNTVELDIEGIE